MNGYRIPMGLGMNPSMSDINSLLVFTMSITFTALGLINLLLAGTPEKLCPPPSSRSMG
jgi:hypothetical protein